MPSATWSRSIRQAFSYAFSDRPVTHAGAVPQLEFRTIDESPFEVLGSRVTPIRLQHGPHFRVLRFPHQRPGLLHGRQRDLPSPVWGLLEGLDTLVLDALRDRPHPTHFSLEQAIAVAERLSRGGRSSRTCPTNWTTTRSTARLPAPWNWATTG